MFTLRALPAGANTGNVLLAAYHDGLRRHWSPGRRALGRLLDAAGQGGWSRSELRLLGEAIRHQGLSMRDRKGLHRLLNPAAFPFEANPLKNKQLFASRAIAAGLPLPASCDPGATDLAAWLKDQDDIIAKPSFRSKGQGVERFQRRGEDWHGASGLIDEATLLVRLHALWKAGGVIQRRLPTHPDLVGISPGALPTLRVVTCIDEAGAPQACELALRLSASAGRPVDNFNAGNLVLGIDDKGDCGPAWLGGGAGMPGRHDRHPRTGGAILGRPVPDLAAAVAVAVEAHRHFQPGFTVIGWDIGLTAEGPVLVEGNWNPGTDILQLVNGKGLAQSRLGALYLHHLRALPEQRWRAARAIEREPRRP